MMKRLIGINTPGLGLQKNCGFISPWVAVVLIAIVAAVVCVLTIRQRDSYKTELELRNRDFEVRVNSEKVKITGDLEEKYRADRISYEVMARRIEMSKNQLRATEERRK